MAKVVYSDRHLTDEGWINGTERWDDGTLKLVNPPDGTAMTVRYTAPATRPPYVTTQWKTDKEERLKDLLEKFGEMPQDLREMVEQEW